MKKNIGRSLVSGKVDVASSFDSVDIYLRRPLLYPQIVVDSTRSVACMRLLQIDRPDRLRGPLWDMPAVIIIDISTASRIQTKIRGEKKRRKQGRASC